MSILIRTRQALVKCKACGAQTPSLTRGVPILPARVPCSVCGARQVYRPSEVFFGSVPQVWKRGDRVAMPVPERNHVQVVRCKGCKRCVPISVEAVIGSITVDYLSAWSGDPTSSLRKCS